MAITLVAGSESEKFNNTAKIADASSQHEELEIPRGTIFCYGTSDIADFDGSARWNTKGSFGYSTGNNPGLVGNHSLLLQTRYGYPLLRVPGAGFFCNSPVGLYGDGISPAIEVVGKFGPIATGWNVFNYMFFENWDVCFDAIQDGGTDENHADNTIVFGCQMSDCRTFFRSTNQQSVNWMFYSCWVNILTNAVTGTVLKPDAVFAELHRGGMCRFYNAVINHPRCTFFDLWDYSPHNAMLVARDVTKDRFADANQYMKIVRFQGDYRGEWSLDFSGFFATYDSPFPHDEMFDVPSNLPRKNWRVQVTHY